MPRIAIAADVAAGTISRHLYGHFAEHLDRCIYDGFFVGGPPVAGVHAPARAAQEGGAPAGDRPGAIPNTRGIRDDQAMVLTEGGRMLRTPTYHVFEMYVPHHDATCLPCHVDAGTLGEGDTAVPASAPREVAPVDFDGARVTVGGFDADLPPRSVVCVTAVPHDA